MKNLFLAFVLLFLLSACQDDNTQNEKSDFQIYTEQVQEYMIPDDMSKEVQYDYYEIADETILESMKDISYANLVNITALDDPNYNNSIYEVDKKYMLTNSLVDKNESVDAMIFYSHDTLTNINVISLYKKGFGLYFVQKDFCTINANYDNCKTYLYAR